MRKLIVYLTSQEVTHAVAEKLLEIGCQIIHVFDRFKVITIVTDKPSDEIRAIEGVEKVGTDGNIHINF